MHGDKRGFTLTAGLTAIVIAFAAVAADAQGFTRQQIHLLIDQQDGAEARAQYIYHYFKRDRDPNLKVPPWVDDVLDAAACAWTAARYERGLARSPPDLPEVGDDGRAVAIWY